MITNPIFKIEPYLESLLQMTTLDTQAWPRGEVPGFELIDEDVGLLRGWIVIS
jgi:hypothetical protein